MAGVTLSTPPARFAWQAWYFLYLHRCQRKLGDILGLMWRRGLLRGRRGTFNTSGSQAWYFLYLHRCQRKLGDILGLMWRRGLLRGRRGTFGTSGSICVAGVVYFLYLHRCQKKLGDEVGLMWRYFRHLRFDLRGRRGIFCATIDVSGSLATK